MAYEVIFHDTMAGFSWKNCYWCGAVAALAYEDSAPWSAAFGSAFGLRSVEFLPAGSEFEVGVILLHFDAVTYCGIEGTTNTDQIISYTLLDFPQSHLSEDWLFPQHFYTLGNFAALGILARVPAGKPLVVCGHSLGGACATIAGEILRRAGRTVRAVYTYGSPRPGNIAFADAYTVPHHRVFSGSDIVTKVAPTWDYLVVRGAGYDLSKSLLSHVGTDHPLSGTDLGEAVFEVIKSIKSFGTYKLWSSVSHHFLGSYMEGIYSNLAPSERDEMSLIYSTLVPLGSHGISETPPSGFNLTTPPEEISVAARSEEEAIGRCIGPSGSYRVHLFTGPLSLPDDVSSVAFAEPAFPGYESLPLPGETLFSRNAAGFTETADLAVAFESTAEPDRTQLVRGAYVSAPDSEGVRKPLAALPFASPKRVSAAGARVDVRVKLKCAEVSK